VRAQIATDCCCWHASRRRRVKPSIRPADTPAADCCWLSPAATALPGGRGRGSASWPPARTLRTRTRTGQMAVCVRGHITANQNQFFESIARGVIRAEICGWARAAYANYLCPSAPQRGDASEACRFIISKNYSTESRPAGGPTCSCTSARPVHGESAILGQASREGTCLACPHACVRHLQA
jgi:hypothetical protein